MLIKKKIHKKQFLLGQSGAKNKLKTQLLLGQSGARKFIKQIASSSPKWSTKIYFKNSFFLTKVAHKIS
jgi:hypothetical protein